MKTKGILGMVAAIVLTAMALALAAPVDHVFVSNNKLDKLNLDGSLDMQFMPGSIDGVCYQIAVNGQTGDAWLGCMLAIQSEGAVFHFDANGNVIQQCSVATMQFCISGGAHVDGGSCIDPYGNAWFTDRPNNRVWKYLPDGTRFGPYSTGGLNSSDIACDSFGNVWTTNNSSGNVSKLANNGSLISTYPYGGNNAIVVDQDNNIWVCEGNGIRKLDINGNNLGYFSINLPTKIAIDNAGNIWISRSVDNLVTKLSPAGANLGNFSVSGGYGIAIDASGNVWVTGASDITKLSNTGINLGTFPIAVGGGEVDSGFLHQRFVLGYNSVEGPNVWVPLNGGAPVGAVTLWFDYINAKGDTSYTESGTGTAPPGGWKLGTPPRYYDITSTATYTGNIEVCIGYNESEFSDEAALKIFHNDGSWTDVTTSLDTTNNIVCGTVTGLSEFAPMEPAAGPGPAIPTVSEWVLILMAAMLMIVIVWRFRRQNS